MAALATVFRFRADRATVRAAHHTRRTFAALAVLIPALLVAAPARAQNADWKADWDKTVAAANQEGQVVISGPSGRGWREFLTQRFQKDFPKIALKLTASAGRDFWPRLVKEREVGEYLWDMRVGGSDDNTHVLKTQGVFDTTRDKLVLPEVLDENAWWGGLDALFVSLDHKTLLAFAMYEQGMAEYNRRVYPKGVNLADLTKPEWKGKIAMADPRGGSSLNTLSVLMKAYGEPYVRTLMVDQNVTITKDPRQQLEWLVSGRYPVSFGLPTAAEVEYAARGGDLSAIGKTEGPKSWTQGVGGISLINRAPHPNAAKVFINWVLTRQIQSELMQAVKLNSRRKDVPLGDPASAIDTARLSEYVGSQHEEIDEFHKRTSALLRELGK